MQERDEELDLQRAQILELQNLIKTQEGTLAEKETELLEIRREAGFLAGSKKKKTPRSSSSSSSLLVAAS